MKNKSTDVQISVSIVRCSCWTHVVDTYWNWTHTWPTVSHHNIAPTCLYFRHQARWVIHVCFLSSITLEQINIQSRTWEWCVSHTKSKWNWKSNHYCFSSISDGSASTASLVTTSKTRVEEEIEGLSLDRSPGSRTLHHRTTLVRLLVGKWVRFCVYLSSNLPYCYPFSDICYVVKLSDCDTSP